MRTHSAGLVGVLLAALCALPVASLAQEATTPASLLPFTRLPLGFPNGWGWVAETVEKEAVTEQVVPGEGGGPALLLKSTDRYSLLGCGALPVPKVAAPYSLLIRARCVGRGGLQPMIFADNDPKLAERSFPLTEQYQTVSLDFTSPDPATFKFMAFSMGVYGDVVIAGIAVVPAAEPAGFDFASTPQVAFQVAPGGDASIARIFFSDEPALVDYFVSGGVAGATLKTQLVTVYGDTFPLPGIVLRQDNQPGQVELLKHLPANRQMGSFRIEGWVERDGKRVSSEQEYVFHRIPRPRYWGKDAPQSLFGIHTLPNPRHLTMAKAAGLNWIRTIPGSPIVSWANLEPAKGQWKWDDADIHRMRQYKFSLLAGMMTTPAWASALPPGDAAKTVWGVPEMKDFDNYVRQFVTRYKGVVQAYDVWNEPWYVGQLVGSYANGTNQYPKDPAAVYAQLAKTVYDNVHSLDPRATVVSLGLGSGEADDASPVLLGAYQIHNWDSLILRTGAYNYTDALYGHMYLDNELNLFPGDRVETLLASVNKALAYFKIADNRKQYWNTEGSPMQVTLKQGLYRRTFPAAEKDDLVQEGNVMARYLASSVANGIARTILYTLHAQWYSLKPIQFNSMAVGGGWMHPVGAAIAQSAWQLDGTRFVKRLDLGGGMHAYFYEGDGRAVAAVSSGPTFPLWTLPAATPAGIRALDVFGNPVAAGHKFDGNMLWVDGRAVGELERYLTQAR